MRRLFAAVLAAVMLMPGLALGDDQQMAQQIANNIRSSGKLQGYSIGVKYRDGTAWLQGQVTDRRQMATAIALAQRQDGVTKVVNNLTIAGAQPAANVQLTSGISGQPAARPMAPMPVGRAMPAAAMAAAGAVAGAPVMAAGGMGHGMGTPIPSHIVGAGGVMPAAYDHPHMPNYAWPSYAAHPNYAAVTYPKQYSASVWPYIGPFYPYPQVPLGWRKVTLEWDDGWWHLDFREGKHGH